MCRNIKPLFNFDPPATDEEITAAALQYVRKVSGFNKPSLANETVFNKAVAGVARASRELIGSLATGSPARSRVAVELRARERALKRFPKSRSGRAGTRRARRKTISRT